MKVIRQIVCLSKTFSSLYFMIAILKENIVIMTSIFVPDESVFVFPAAKFIQIFCFCKQWLWAVCFYLDRTVDDLEKVRVGRMGWG